MKNVLRAAAASAALLLAAAPAAVLAATESTGQPQHFAFRTQLSDRYHAGAYEGTLSLNVYPNGVVQGLYTPFDGTPQNVAGGMTGSQIWFDLGRGADRFHVIGTLRNGALHATAQIPGPDVWEFDSVSGG